MQYQLHKHVNCLKSSLKHHFCRAFLCKSNNFEVLLQSEFDIINPITPKSPNGDFDNSPLGDRGSSNL